jgi:hypothetical protein
MSDIEDSQIVCTSCKAKEHAEARCQDCANFLCPNCIIAHQFMRCFENHKVCFEKNEFLGRGKKVKINNFEKIILLHMTIMFISLNL